jgi:four helix bundle protein
VAGSGSEMTNYQAAIPNESSNHNAQDRDRVMRSGAPEPQKKFDLEERTARFGEAVIAFLKNLRHDPISTPLISQLVRSATSIGANYCEADDAESKRDFRHKIAICRKECRETKHWLRMIVAANPATREEARRFWQEAQELTLIFAAIGRNTK